MYCRKTEDEWQIHQLTECGWEEISAYKNRWEALVDLRLYRSNQPEFKVKLVKVRVKRRMCG